MKFKQMIFVRIHQKTLEKDLIQVITQKNVNHESKQESIKM